MAILSNTHKVNVEKFTFGGQNPQEGWAQSCTSVAVWLVFSVISPLASQHRWRFICCLLPLDSFFSFSIPNPIPPLSGACLPAEVLYLAACLSDLSFSCGCRPPSVAVTANRHAIGPFQLMILSLGLNCCCCVNPLPHIFYFSQDKFPDLYFFFSLNHADVTDVQNRQTRHIYPFIFLHPLTHLMGGGRVVFKFNNAAPSIKTHTS